MVLWPLIAKPLAIACLCLTHASALGSDKATCPSRQPGQSATAAASSLYTANRYQEALGCLVVALAERPSARAHTNVANALVALGRTGEAWTHTERALAAAPRDDAAVLWTAATVAYQLRKFPHALELCERILALDPTNVKVPRSLVHLFAPSCVYCAVTWVTETPPHRSTVKLALPRCVRAGNCVEGIDAE